MQMNEAKQEEAAPRPKRTPQGTLDTSKAAFLVTRQFYERGSRFDTRASADAYANALAARLNGEHVEVFECVENRYAAIPVVVVSGQDDAGSAP
jgi:hypothetical protein